MRLAGQIAIVAVLALGGVGLWQLTAGGDGTAAQQAGPQARPVAVVGAVAKRGSVTVKFDAVGTLRANEAITVTSKQAGIVRAIGFTEGQPVEAGQVLLELDDTEARAELALAESQRRTVVQELERSTQLLGRQAVAQARVDDLKIELQGAEARVNAARSRLQDLTIRAPFAGVTGLRQVSPGALVRPADEVTTLDDVRTMKLEFRVPETALGSLRPGGAVTAFSTAFTGDSFQGDVDVIDARIDPVTRTVAVVATLPNPDLRLRPGMFMTVALTLERRDNVVMIPEESLVPTGDRQFAFVVVDGKATRRQVRIGTRQDGWVEVMDGVTDGDVLITRGVQKVRDGQPVKVEIAGTGTQSAQRPNQS